MSSSSKVLSTSRARIPVTLLLAAQALTLALAPTEARSANVVLIMADDLGYHDLSSYGHPKIKTPVLDQLAADGVKLTSFYAGATVCTPSRIALLTGCYPARLGWTKGVIGHLMKKGMGLNPKALTMAEIFQAAGHATGLVGKWHLGDHGDLLPHRQGFDSTYYIKRSNNQTDELWQNDQLLEKPFENRLLTEQFTREASRFIKTHRDRPFFLYLPYTAPHFPIEPHPDWRDQSKFGAYGDVVEEMDHRIGEILHTLESENLASKTLVIFLSDNGPEPLTKESRATPFRGRKWDALEGGTRVPCILRWPGVLPPGKECDHLIAAIDLLPTLSRACGLEARPTTADHLPIDGVDVWPTLLGEIGNAGHPRNDLLYWHGSNGFQAIRVGQWKLFPKGKGAALKGASVGGPALFHLAQDPGETKNLSLQHSDRVKTMRELAEKRLVALQDAVLPLGEE